MTIKLYFMRAFACFGIVKWHMWALEQVFFFFKEIMKENSCGFSKYLLLSVRIAIFHKVIHTVFSLKNLKGTI